MPQFGTTISPNAYDKNTKLMAEWSEILKNEKAAQQEQENIAKIKVEIANAEKKFRQLQANNSRLQSAFLKG